MKLFSFLVKYSSGVLVLAVITGMGSGVASAVLMALINHKLARLGTESNLLAWGFVGVTITTLLSHVCSRLLLLKLSTKAVLKMRMDLCNQILVSSLRQVESHGASRMLAALTEDVLAVADTLANFPLLCINVSIIIACIAYLLWLCWQLALGFIACFIVGVLIYEAIESRTRPYLAQGREKWDELIGYYQALVYGNKELKLHRERRKAFLAEGLQPTATAMQKLSFTWHSIFAIAASYGQILYFVVVGTILFIAPKFGRFDLPVLTGFTLLIIYMTTPISFIVGIFPALQRAAVSLEKVESLGFSLSTGGPSDMQEETSQPAEKLRRITTVGLKYTYRNDEERVFTLGPIDVSIEPGELVFIIGGNGSGKSSFARVLTGLYVPEEGAIMFNGAPVTDANRDHYRQHFSTVFSDYFLFDKLFGLISENSQNKIMHYLKKLQLTSKVSITDGKFSTTSLSQGQRKRLALLTAFMEDRDIYLFDEWAADQDPVFKDTFYHQILGELKAREKTVIVISHDENFYHVADRIIKFEDGVIVDDYLNTRSTQAQEQMLTGR